MASGFIQPRQVSPGAWKDWIREGFELVSRKWPAWIVIMTTVSWLAGAAGMAEPIAEFLALAVGFNLAVAVDYESDWTGLATRFRASLREAARFGFQVGMFVWVVTFPLDMTLAFSKAALESQAASLMSLPALAADLAGSLEQGDIPALLAPVFKNSANHLLTWAMVLPVGIGFLYPLRTLGLGFADALLFGRKASTLNRKAILLTAALSVVSALTLVTLALYPLIPLAQGFWMAVNYAMYRDIFLGRPRNHPARARAANLTGTPATVAIPVRLLDP